MLLSSFVGLTLSGGVLASSSTNLFGVNFPIAAYPVASQANVATTYLVGCLSGTSPETCNFKQPYTLVEGPKTVSFEFVAPLANAQTQSFTLQCDVEGTTSMACMATGLASDSLPNTPVTTTESLMYTGKEAASFFKPIQIITDSASLMTYTPGAKATSAAITGPVIGDTSIVSATNTATTGIVLGTATPSVTKPKSGAGTSCLDERMLVGICFLVSLALGII